MLLRNRKADDIHYGRWCGLGGKFEPGETPEACVCREVREESGLEISEPELKGLMTLPRFKDGVDWYVFVFVATRFSGTLAPACAEGELAWIDDDELLGLNLWEGDPVFLKRLADPGFFSATFEYVDGKLVRHDMRRY